MQRVRFEAPFWCKVVEGRMPSVGSERVMRREGVLRSLVLVIEYFDWEHDWGFVNVPERI